MHGTDYVFEPFGKRHRIKDRQFETTERIEPRIALYMYSSLYDNCMAWIKRSVSTKNDITAEYAENCFLSFTRFITNASRVHHVKRIAEITKQKSQEGYWAYVRDVRRWY